MQPHAPLGSLHGLGQIYAVQTAKACGRASGTGTLTHLAQHVADLVARSPAPALAVFDFLTAECAANPRAGQMTETMYIVPKYNLFVARTLLNVLHECLRYSSMFPMLAAHAEQLHQALEAVDTMIPTPAQARSRRRGATAATAAASDLL
jgi:hypothetical protein